MTTQWRTDWELQWQIDYCFICERTSDKASCDGFLLPLPQRHAKFPHSRPSTLTYGSRSWRSIQSFSLFNWRHDEEKWVLPNANWGKRKFLRADEPAEAIFISKCVQPKSHELAMTNSFFMRCQLRKMKEMRNVSVNIDDAFIMKTGSFDHFFSSGIRANNEITK